MEAFVGSAIGNILLSILANVLTETLLYSCKALEGEEPLKPYLDTTLAPILQKAVAAVARSTEYNDKIQTQKLRMFLASPEVEAIVRQIYASKLVPEQSSQSKSIRQEFITLFALNLDSEQQTHEKIATEIFDAILTGCEKALEVAINRGVLAAHEAKSVVRYQMLRDELAAIQRNLTFLTGQQRLDIQAILEFEKKYRQQISSRHGYITPPNFDTARKLPIDRLYVSPSFIRISSPKDEQTEIGKIDDFCSVIYRAVLLGNPGGGKSTFSDKLSNDLATRYSEKLLAGRQVTPIHVVLRDYGSAKKEYSCSILQFIQTTAVSKYQLESPPLGTFEYLLLNGRVVVIFDGLDELLDTSYRQEISGDVESFCSLYPSVPVLVTSREVGYKEAPLDEEKFEIFRLGSFDDDQVKDYVDKWFLATGSELEKERHDKVKAFIQESNVVPDLSSNPLMLALLCNIYRGEGYIPRNRPDVYEKCAVMLFERWDRGRGIEVYLPFQSRIIFAMMYLAHWIYTNETLQGGVTEGQLIAKATDYLCQRQFEDRDEAEKAGCDFIQFCRGRAWVFTDTGTMKGGERLYQFTHRTFLEYFTARHLVRISRNPENLQETLLPKICKREWDVVAQLAFRIQDKETEGAGDELLSTLIQKSHKTQGSEKWNLISFAARCLEFMVPSPSVRRDITKACLEFCIEWGIEQIENKQLSSAKLIDFDVAHPARELLSELLNSALENRTTIAETWKKLIIDIINDLDNNKSFIAYEIGVHSDIALVFNNLSTQRTTQEYIEFWRGISEFIFESCLNRIKTLSSKYYLICIDCIKSRKVSISELVDWHGINNLFENSSYTIFPNVVRSPVVELLWYNTFYISKNLPENSQEPHRLLCSDLSDLGQIFASYSGSVITPLQLDARFDIFHKFERRYSKDFHKREQLQLSPNALFGAFIIVAVSLEIKLEYSGNHKNIKAEKILENFGLKQLAPLDSFQFTFLSRFKPVDENMIQGELEKSSLTLEHKAFVWQWVRREINLVAKSSSKDKKKR
ncbi:NACHT domain-containing protein [Microcoleus sp. Pol12A5]|uniref:NACHT domain-containing protein n=1 Tax=Microcoleus sp. Pol12A5 TaxID=3055392 RepID=UPI002FD44F84